MSEKLRLFVAEGPPGEAAAVLRELFPEEQGRLELTEISGFPTLMASLEFYEPEAILFDLALAHPEPLEAVRRLHRAKPIVPLIVIAKPADKPTAIACLEQGAMDYLLKGSMDAPTMERMLRGALKRNTLRGLADLLRDPLTGLYARDGFLTLGERAMETAREEEGDLVLLCARIENLQAIREEFGQSAAENSLQEIAGLLTRSFRRTDIVARIGESQFAALAVDAAEPSVPVLLQRLRKHLAALNHDIGPWGPLELRMTARFWPRKESGTLAEFLDEVEAGLREAELAPAGDSQGSV
jgi:diguanylate cyclase (GGDEF)-like protein